MFYSWSLQLIPETTGLKSLHYSVRSLLLVLFLLTIFDQYGTLLMTTVSIVILSVL